MVPCGQNDNRTEKTARKIGGLIYCMSIIWSALMIWYVWNGGFCDCRKLLISSRTFKGALLCSEICDLLFFVLLTSLLPLSTQILFVYTCIASPQYSSSRHSSLSSLIFLNFTFSHSSSTKHFIRPTF